jgi:glucose-1-phosphate adenylyltransferase
VVDRAILDKEVQVGPNAVVGMGNDFSTPNQKEPGRLNTGITLIGKRAVIPAGARIGRNARIAEGVRAADFTSRTVKSGGSVDPRGSRAEGARRTGVGSLPDSAPAPVVARAGRGTGRA